LGKNGRCNKCNRKFLIQAPQPADDYDLAPIDAPAPFTPAPQPLAAASPPRAPTPALPNRAAAPALPKGPKKQDDDGSDMSTKQILLLAGGGIAFLLLVVVGVLAFVFTRGGSGAGGGSFSGGFAVVDSLPSPPPEPADQSVPLDVEAIAQAAWSVKPDPPSGDDKVSAEMVGALSPDQTLLLSSLGGNYAVGVTLGQEPVRRDKVVKRPDGSRGEVISIDKEPHPILDVRTGKPAGQFPAEARIRFNCRLSPDGRYLASSVVEIQQTFEPRIVKDELVVWQRDGDQPVCRWPMPGPVVWADFIGPDRLALYHVTPSPQFVVLDVTKGTPVVTAPLPGEEFHPEHDTFHKRKNFTSYRVWTPGGAVSPGRKWVALGGSKSIVLVDTAGKIAGKLPIEPVSGVRGYLNVSFSGDGTQLRALTQHGQSPPVLRVWSLADGKSLRKKPCPFQLRDGENPYHENAPGPAILDGPAPNSLIVGHQLFDLASDQKLAELPYQPLRWAGPNRLLALGSADQAASTKELNDTADFVPPGKSLIVAAFDGAALIAQAPKPPADPNARPAPTAADRSKGTAIQLKPPAAWGVKPGAEVARPPGPLPVWPQAFAATEAAVISEYLEWIRYDLNTGDKIGQLIDLWPGQTPNEPVVGWHTAALTRDGQKLALVDPKDKARVDVWDNTGKHLIGLHPYGDDPVVWLGWSSDGKLLTADRARLSGWDVATGQAAFEVVANLHWFESAPGAEWVLVMTPARHLFFVDASTGQCLGHIPANPALPEHTLSPDGKTLLRLGQGLNVQAWDLQTGKRKSERETPLVPISLTAGVMGVAPEGMRLGVFWIGPRLVLSHTKSPGEQQPRYYLYDLDAHTHTYSFPTNLGVFQNDSLGRPWMTSQAGGVETWIAADVPGAKPFDQTLAFGPGTTVQVEVDVGSGDNSQKTAKKMAESLHSRGFKIGRGGWVLRADHKTGTATTDLTDLMGQAGISVATLTINWRLLDPQGNEIWKGTSGGKFDPFNSKYVVVGSRRTDMAPGGMGGGSMQVELDYGGKDAMTAQVEEILENNWYPGVPTCLVQSEGKYVALPLAASEGSKQKP
jgi:hypothetical protein